MDIKEQIAQMEKERDYWKMMYENLTKQLNHAVKNAPYYIGKK